MVLVRDATNIQMISWLWTPMQRAPHSAIGILRWTHLHPISTPLDINNWYQHLQSYPDQHFVLEGITHGFRIGMDHTVTLSSSKCNHPLVHHQPWVVDEYISSEQRVGRFSLPFPREVVMECHKSILGLIQTTHHYLE